MARINHAFFQSPTPGKKASIKAIRCTSLGYGVTKLHLVGEPILVRGPSACRGHGASTSVPQESRNLLQCRIRPLIMSATVGVTMISGLSPASG